MKYFLVIALFFISGKTFSQTDSTDKVTDIFLISFLNKSSDVSEIQDVKMVYLDSNSLTYENPVYNNISNSWSPQIIEVKYDKLRSFGYKVGTNIGVRVSRGALAGFGLGFVIGFIGGKINIVGDGSSESTFGDRMSTGSLFGLLLSLPGALIGAITGLGSKEYEVLDVTKYNNAKKYNIVKNMMSKGMKYNNE